MIEIGIPEPRLFISRYIFSIIDSEVRRQVLWCQYIAKDGKVMGIGRFRLLGGSYMEYRIRTMRAEYLKKMRMDRLKRRKKMYHNKDHYMNAYQELMDVLMENGKIIIQIEWVSTKGRSIDVNFFLLACEGTFYTNPSPCGSLDPHPIVAGSDFWLTRESEGRIKDVDYWSFHSMPKEPQERAKSLTLFKMYPNQGESPLI